MPSFMATSLRWRTNSARTNGLGLFCQTGHLLTVDRQQQLLWQKWHTENRSRKVYKYRHTFIGFDFSPPCVVNR
jgi:hypothetical protein